MVQNNESILIEKLNKHLDLVIEANKQVNLTRITNREQGKVLHIEDSLAAVEELSHAPEGVFADLGSGAGYPGIPLSLASGRKGILVESVGKKAACLHSFINKLDLQSQLQVYSGRAETLALEQPQRFNTVTARALSSIPSLMELSSPLLCEGGRLICLKSSHIDEEIQDAIQIEEKLALYLISDRELQLSDGSPRRIVVFEKRGQPQVSLPRRDGMAQKRPYRK